MLCMRARRGRTCALLKPASMHARACRPGGRVRVLVRATYLQHSAPGEDGLTDLSRLSLGPSSRPSSFSGLEEQVLANPSTLQPPICLCRCRSTWLPLGWTPVPPCCVQHAQGICGMWNRMGDPADLQSVYVLQDLNGFDAEMSLKAIHPAPAQPQAAAAAASGQSALLSLPPRTAELQQQGGRAPIGQPGTPSKPRTFGRSASHTAGEGGATPAAAERGRGYGRSMAFTPRAAGGSTTAVQQQQAPKEVASRGSGQLTSVHVRHLSYFPGHN